MNSVTSHLIAPHGGKLVDLCVSSDRATQIKNESRDWPSWDLTPRQVCDLELLCNGGFSPLTGFMVKADYDSVCDKMRLKDGTLWPMPITLDVSQEFADKVRNLGIFPLGNTPQELDLWMRGQIARWAEIAKAANIKAD